MPQLIAVTLLALGLLDLIGWAKAGSSLLELFLWFVFFLYSVGIISLIRKILFLASRARQPRSWWANSCAWTPFLVYLLLKTLVSGRSSIREILFFPALGILGGVLYAFSEKRALTPILPYIGMGAGCALWFAGNL